MAKRLKKGFYRRGSVIWIATDPITGKRRSTGCTDPQAAESWAADRQRILVDPTYRAAHEATVGEWVNRMFKIKAATRSEGTQHMYRVKLGHVARFFGESSPLANINPDTVDAFVTQRSSEGAINNTIARELSCLLQLLRHAKRAGMYFGDLATIMPIGFSAKYVPVKRTLARADLPKLLAALRNDKQRAWVCFAIAFAADAADIHRATIADYDPSQKTMRLRGTKTTSRDTEVPVLACMQELVDYALPRLPVRWNRNSHDLGEACARAGLRHLSPKDLRRTASSWLMEEGADQSIVSRFMRHKTDAMVRKVYGQVRPRKVGDLIDSRTKSSQVAIVETFPCVEAPGEFCSYSELVAPIGVEPIRPYGQGILKAARVRWRRSAITWRGRKTEVRRVAIGRERVPAGGVDGTSSSQRPMGRDGGGS
jgi:integrase